MDTVHDDYGGEDGDNGDVGEGAGDLVGVSPHLGLCSSSALDCSQLSRYLLLHNIPSSSGVFDAGAEFNEKTGGGSWNTHSHTEPRVVDEDIVCFVLMMIKDG